MTCKKCNTVPQLVIFEINERTGKASICVVCECGSWNQYGTTVVREVR